MILSRIWAKTVTADKILHCLRSGGTFTGPSPDVGPVVALPNGRSFRLKPFQEKNRQKIITVVQNRLDKATQQKS